MDEMNKENGWDRVARWAGINNNKENMESGSIEAMQDETVEQASEPETAGVHEHGEEQVATPINLELEQIRAERDQLIDRLARLQAEFDNARKREVKERADARDYTITNTVEPFLGVMDNFQLALKADGTADQLRGGVELILKQMEDALKSLNVQAVESVGAQFDPRIHEALGNIQTLEFPDHQILEEIRRGYKIREKLLRPALVRIASNPGQVSE
jgi:molecular chaperone GrpE